MFIYIKRDAESNETTPAISVPPFHEDIYVYIYVCMYSMPILDEITRQVSRSVHILIRETFIYMTMDATHNETNPTIPFRLSYEDFDVHSTHISKQNKKIHIIEYSSGHVYIHENGR